MTDMRAFEVWIVVGCIGVNHAWSQERTPEAILAEVEVVGEPPFDPARKPEPGYLENYKREQHILYRKKAALLSELCAANPGDPRTPEWMNRRWKLLGWNQEPRDVAAEVLADIESVPLTNANPQVVCHATYWKAYYEAQQRTGHAPEMLERMEPFLSTCPTDERGATLLSLVAEDGSADNELRLNCFQRLAKHYPNTHQGRFAPGMIRRIDGVGKLFELSFRDVVSGREVSIEGLRGKVVVIDFWATTCAPCVAELPRLKKLYAQFHDRGVEFIGVSLDEPVEQGGRRALLDFVKEKEVSWPQYYQGEGYDSEFSRSWGVGSAPTMFVVDKTGKLRSIEASENLEELLTQFVAE